MFCVVLGVRSALLYSKGTAGYCFNSSLSARKAVSGGKSKANGRAPAPNQRSTGACECLFYEPTQAQSNTAGVYNHAAGGTQTAKEHGQSRGSECTHTGNAASSEELVCVGKPKRKAKVSPLLNLPHVVVIKESKRKGRKEQ